MINKMCDIELINGKVKKCFVKKIFQDFFIVDEYIEINDCYEYNYKYELFNENMYINKRYVMLLVEEHELNKQLYKGLKL